MKNEKKAESVSFEEALTRLGEIVKLLENGQAPLEQSLSLYEEGVGLVRLCNDRLDGAEKKIRELIVVDPAAENTDGE